jgi:UDP-N-acetylmuramoylalanine--D-glutamate ligase
MLCPATIIAVTGSNGKTTVATLIGKLLEAAGKKVFTCGNIGRPFCGELQKLKEGDLVCLEVSSFQLETIDKFKPKVAVILNFSPNHLDRHKDMQEYLEAKKRIFKNQDKTDYLVLNENDPVVKGLAQEARAEVTYFKEKDGLNPNEAAALTVGSLFGVDKKTCRDVFANFKGVEHRLEQVAEIKSVEFINDSKSTTVEATAWALKTLPRPVILIAGGRDKNLDYRAILDLAVKKAKEIILIGEAKDKIRAALKGHPAIAEASSLEEAVNVAFRRARPGDCVLLSPMCASFDMFADFEDRGRVFKQIVRNIAKRES